LWLYLQEKTGGYLAGTSILLLFLVTQSILFVSFDAPLPERGDSGDGVPFIGALLFGANIVAFFWFLSIALDYVFILGQCTIVYLRTSFRALYASIARARSEMKQR
jgi:hypothetical protein